MRKNSLLLLTMVLTVFLAGIVMADVTLQVEQKTVYVGTTGNTLNVLMDNPGDVAACQMDLLFDTSCFTVDPASLAKTSRTSTIDIFQASTISGGIRIAMTGIGHKITPGNGPVATFAVDVGAGCAVGDYVFNVTGAVVADPMGASQPVVEVDNPIAVDVAQCIPEFNATTFALGNVRLNGVGTAALTIKNVGNAAGSVAITGVPASPATFSLAIGATQAVTLSYTPATEGAFTATAHVAGCGETDITLTGTGVCSKITTNCPLAFGDVTIVETKTLNLTITNPGTAPLNVSAINFSDDDFTAGALPGAIAGGGNANVAITVAPGAVEGAVTATATVVSDACSGNYTCTMTVNKLTPPYVIVSVCPACQVIKPLTPFEIQIGVSQVTSLMPIYSMYFELFVDTCANGEPLAWFDSTSLSMEFDDLIPECCDAWIDSMGWDTKVHYPDMGTHAIYTPQVLQVWITAGIPLTFDACLLNIGLVPNAACITDSGWTCGGDTAIIHVQNVLVNEGEPEAQVANGTLIINNAPVWSGTNPTAVVRMEGYDDPDFPFDPACFDNGDFCFTATDADGDTMTLTYVRDPLWAAFDASPYLPQPVSVTVSPLVPVIDPATGDTLTFALDTNPFDCGGPSQVVWCWHWAPDKDFFVANFGAARPLTFTDTYTVTSSALWNPPGQSCTDVFTVTYTLERLDAYAEWVTAPSYACAGPEPIVQLCADRHYYANINALPEDIYSVDIILDYADDCLEPYEVGFEGLGSSAGQLWDEIAALTYSINEEAATICASIAFNEAVNEPQNLCIPLLYVGFRLKTEGENAACTTDHCAELSIEHVKINEAGMGVCWHNGCILYEDFELVGNISISDGGPGIVDVTVELYDEYPDGELLDAVITDGAGNYGFGPLVGCQPYCAHPVKSALGDPDVHDYVTAQDASMILRSLCHQVTLTHDQQLAADVTCDGSVTAYDAATLLRWVVGYDVTSCIGSFVFEYVGTGPAIYLGEPYVCLPEIIPYTNAGDFEAALRGDVTQNYGGSPKTVVITPEMQFKGNTATITMAGEVYSAVLELVGVKASHVTANGMECQWISDGNVTKIAVASGTPVSDAAIVVEIASGAQVELYGNVNEVPFATRMEKVPVIPADFSLAQNYPNPFNPETSIEFGLPVDSKVTVTVYNVLGQVVTTLVNEELTAGYHMVRWDGSNIASGIYFYRIDAGNYTATKSMILMK